MKSMPLLLLFLCVFFSAVAGAGDGVTGTVAGRLMLNSGKPMANGQVFFFRADSDVPPVLGKYWRVPDAAADIDGEGRFTLRLGEGTYYIGAVKRMSGEKYGPPLEGDYFLPSHDAHGKYQVYTVTKGALTNIGTIEGVAPYKSDGAGFNGEVTAVEGTILDADGKPLEGALVLAYLDPSMKGRPLFVSGRTGKDGKYLLRVHAGGAYYLKVRDVYGGGVPASGQILGGYGEQNHPSAVMVETGKTRQGIDIRVKRFKGRGYKE